MARSVLWLAKLQKQRGIHNMQLCYKYHTCGVSQRLMLELCFTKGCILLNACMYMDCANPAS